MRFTPVLTLMMLSLNIFSQGYTFNWVKSIGSTYDEQDTRVIAIDHQNNSYVAGSFYNSDFDFDPSSASYTLDPATGYGYLAKYDSTGSFVWAKNFGPSNALSTSYYIMFKVCDMKFDSNNELLLAGAFSGGGDFDPSSSTFTMGFNGSSYDGGPFICKFNQSGNFLNGQVLANSLSVTPMSGSGEVRSLAFDASGNILVTGSLDGTLDFDPSPSSTVAVTNTLSGSYANRGSFLAKYTSGYALMWAENLGVDDANSLALNSNGDIFVVGTFKSGRDFDPSSLTYTLSAWGQDIFLSKYDSNGDFLHAISMGTEGTDRGTSIVVDNSSNVYITGAFPNAMDFDPVGTNVLTVIGGTNWAQPTTDIYVAKYTPSLTLTWARNNGGALYDGGQKIILDKNQDVLVAGSFQFMGANYAIFDGGMLLKYTSAGDLAWRAPYNGYSNTYATCISVDTAAKNVFVTGFFRNVTDFDPHVFNSYTLSSIPNSYDAYIMRFSPCVAPSITAVSQSTNNVCQGAAVTLSVSGQLNGSEFWNWSSGSCSSVNIGQYAAVIVHPTVTTVYYVKGVGGCNVPGSCSSITVNVLPKPTVTLNLPAPACYGTTVTVGASGASTYTWSTGSNLSSCIATAAPNAQVTLSATASNGCTLTSVAQVSAFPFTNITISPTLNVFCYGTTTVLTASGANNYTWSSGATQSFMPYTATLSTSFSVTGINQYGCLAGGYYYANAFPLPNVTVSGPTFVCIGQTASLVASGAITFTWTGAGNSKTLVVSPTANTIYTVTGEYIYGCTNTQTVAVVVGTVPVISVSPASVSLCSGATGSFTASGAGSYLWQNTQTGNTGTFSPLTSQVVSVTGTSSSNGCVSSQTAFINVMPLPTLSVSGQGAVCAGGASTLIANGANSYSWNGGPSSSVFVVTPVSTSVYTVVGTGSNGCSASQPFSVVVHPLPQLSISQSASVICAGTPVTFSVSGAASYSWSTGSTSSSFTFSPGVTGAYTVTGTSAVGCSSHASRVVIVNPLPALAVSPASVSACELSEVSFTASGADAYNWNSVNGGAVQSFTPANSVVVPVIGTNTLTGCSSSTAFTISTMPLPAIIVSGANPQCALLSTTISASGASSYVWSTGSLSFSAAVSPSVSTIYTVSGTGLNGCVNSATAGITVFPLPQLIVSPSMTSVCLGSTVDHVVTGAASYTWNNGSTSSSVVTAPAASTVYFVSGTSLDGCVGITSASVIVNQTPQVSVSPSSATVCAGATANFVATGASTYMWSNGATGSNLSVAPLTSTVLILKGLDNNGCYAISSVTLNARPRPLLTVTPASATVCAGEMFAVGVTGASTYTWSGSSSNDSTMLVQVNNDMVLVVVGQGVNLCESSQTVTITADACTGLPYQEIKSVNVFPSPFTDGVVVDGISGTLLAEVYDNLGKCVYRETVSTNYIELQHLPKGIYYLLFPGIKPEGYKIIKD